MSSLLLVAACGGSGVVLQQILMVVERPLEFTAPQQVDVEPVPVPVEPAPVEVPKPTPHGRPIGREVPPRPSPPAVAQDPRPASVPQPVASQPVAPAPEEPKPAESEPAEQPVRAEIRLTGDASRVRVLGGGGQRDLPAFLPLGRYDVEVVFGEGTPFVATSLLVMDDQTQTVACRKALGICTVR